MLLSGFNRLLLSAVLTVSVSVAAATDTPLSIYQLAEKNDAEILAAYAALQAERETKNQSRGALLPSLVLTGEVAANREDIDATTATNSGETSYNSHDVALTLRQPLYRKDLFTDLSITDSNILVAEAEYKAAQQDLITRVLERFFEAQAAFDLADAQVIVAQDLLRDSLDAIKEITGAPPQELAPLGKNFKPITPDPLDADHWVAEAEDNNPTLIASRYQVQTASYEVDRFKSGHYPKFDIVARYGNVSSAAADRVSSPFIPTDSSVISVSSTSSSTR